MRLRAGGRTDIGRLRERNEDAYLIREPLFAVADGMGGHRGGDVASSLALEVLSSAAGEGGGPLERLVAEVKEANRRVLERGSADRALRGMGTTLTAVMAGDGRAYVAHVGDSRAYLLREGSLQQLTEDHTLVQRMVREGRLRPQDAEVHPQRSILTRALGVEDDLAVDQLTLDVRPGDRLLLCTDGLTSMVPRPAIQRVLQSEPDPQRACDLLVEAANRAGGEDNITVVVVDFLEDDPEAGSPGPAARPPGPARSPGPDPRSPAAGSEPARTALIARPPPSERPPPERPPSEPPRGRRVRWSRVALRVGVVLLLVAGALVGARRYIDSQWYVGDAGGRVAIYNGIPASVLGYQLSTVERVTELPTARATALQPWKGLEEGITAGSREEAEAIVDQIRQDLEESSPRVAR